MNCEFVADNISGIVSGALAPTVLDDCKRHINVCDDCRQAMQGAEALALLKDRDTGDAPAGLFDKISGSLGNAPRRRYTGRQFWLGTGFGGAVAASLFSLALTFGWVAPEVAESPAPAEFLVALSEPRMMNVAIETDRPLEGATISIFMSGGVELDGYGHRRELTWTTDLKAGVNRLRLPVFATDEGGGQMIVRLNHPRSEQVFVVRLKAGA